jgi:hypothetical protein
MLQKILVSGYLFLALFLGSYYGWSQSRKIMSGLMLDKTESSPVRMGSITNVTLGKTTLSRTNGTFEIEAGVGNIIAYSANGFYADTFSIKQESFESGNMLIALRPLPSTLENVTVVGKYSRYQVDSIERRRSFLEDVGEKPQTTVSKATDLGFGVGINLDRWSKKEKQERKARDIFALMEEDAYVNYRWNEEIVAKYTIYKEDALIDFIERNRPEYLWLRKHPTEEDIMYYINTSLKKEKKKSAH